MRVLMICLYAPLDTKAVCILTKTQQASGVLLRISHSNKLVSKGAFSKSQVPIFNAKKYINILG